MDQVNELEEEHNSSSVALPSSEQTDIVEKFYKVSVTEPLTDLNNDLCKYFNAKHVDTNEEFHAIVFEKHNTYCVDYLNSLKNVIHYPIITPVAFGVTNISSIGQYCLTVIIKKYDYNNNLVRRIATQGPMSEEEVNEKIIVPITNLLQFCEKSNIEIGNFSPSNFIFTPDNKIICKEFFTSPPHYFQENYLLAPEIANTLPYGRVTKDILADLYAFGLIILYALTGSQLWNKYSDQQYDIMRLEGSSFNILAGKLKIEPSIKNLIKGLLYDTPGERWRVRNVVDWVNGKSTKSLNAENFDAVSPIVFNDTNFQTCRGLAYGLHINWDSALQFMKEERLTKWVQRSLVKTKITESINEIFSEQSNFRYSYTQDKDENLFKLLSAFDRNAPMRLKSFGATVLSIPDIVLYALINRRNDHLEAILKILAKKFWSFLVEKNPNFAQFSEFFLNLETSLKFYNPTVQGFTIERLIYSLNPNLPCLSVNLGGHYVTDVASLLKVLDDSAKSNPQIQIIDRHIVGYIACKLSLKRELRIASIRNFTKFASNLSVTALSYIFLAHQQAPNVSVNNLSNLLASRLSELYSENLHNKRMRELLKKDLSNAGASGDMNALLKIVSDSKIIENDLEGYSKATREINHINENISSLSNKTKVWELGIFFGQRVTVLFSYLLIVLIVVILVF